jgi:hypothetical protein
MPIIDGVNYPVFQYYKVENKTDKTNTINYVFFIRIGKTIELRGKLCRIL